MMKISMRKLELLLNDVLDIVDSRVRLLFPFAMLVSFGLEPEFIVREVATRGVTYYSGKNVIMYLEYPDHDIGYYRAYLVVRIIGKFWRRYVIAHGKTHEQVEKSLGDIENIRKRLEELDSFLNDPLASM